MERLTAAVVALILTIAPALSHAQGQARDEDQKWKLPLQQKAETLLDIIYDIHWLDGTYIPTVQLDPITKRPDHSTRGNTGDMHSSTWTGCFLMGAAFGYGWAKEHGTAQDVETMLNLGGAMVGGLHILSHVSGKPGLIARKIVRGHGPAVEEREGRNERNEWHQGVGLYRNYRWRGHPSHHNYHHVLRGLAYWYYFLSKYDPDPTDRIKAQLDSVKTLYTEMMAYAYKSTEGIVYTIDGRRAASLYRIRGNPSTSGIMATSCLKYAVWITGDAWYAHKYDELTKANRYRETRERLRSEQGTSANRDRLFYTSWDDTEHTLGSLWLVSQLEKDPDLLEFYRLSATALFEMKATHKRSLFNYLYAGLTDDKEGAHLGGALETMRLYPSDWSYFPIMNSIRTDLDANVETPLPFNEIPYDNAYDWKGDPFQVDGRLSREITAFAVSDEDPMVWLLADKNGTLYHSFDGGQTFDVHTFYKDARITSITFAAQKVRAAVVGTDKGVFWTQNGGYRDRWTHVPLGSENNVVHQVIRDTENPDIVWAITSEGIWKSVDLGPEEAGKNWINVSGPFTTRSTALFDHVVYGLKTGKNPVIYAMIDGRTYRRRPGQSQWTQSPIDVEGYHRIPEPVQIAVSSTDPNMAYSLIGLKVWGRDASIIMRTTDGGQTYTAVGSRGRRSSAGSVGSGLERKKITHIAIDAHDPTFVYAASPDGFYRSIDGGENWVLSNTGLRIPLVHHVFAPSEMPKTLFASTPAGLYQSGDRGKTWNPNVLLVLNGRGADRPERGGMAYLVAYWAARYFDLINDEEAHRSPEQW